MKTNEERMTMSRTTVLKHKNCRSKFSNQQSKLIASIRDLPVNTGKRIKHFLTPIPELIRKF